MENDLIIVYEGRNKDVKKQLKEINLRSNRKLSDVIYSPQNPFSAVKYTLELYTSVECDDDQTTYFQKPIGIILCIVELCQIDI